MDSSSKQQKMNDDIDRLSSLPEGLIHKILSFIGTKRVVQTSALSSRWKYTWTSMPYLDFSSKDFDKLPIFSKFVNHVLSGRNNEAEVSSLKLEFRGKVSQVFVKRLVNYAVSHNVQQMTVTCLFENEFEFPLSLFNSRSVKHLSLKTKYDGSRRMWRFGDAVYINPTSSFELPALTTLHLDNVTFSDVNTEKDIGIFSKCANLKNITLKNFKTMCSNGFTICHPQLSNLTLDYVDSNAKVINVVAPQLENLTIMKWSDCLYVVSTPNLRSLVCKGWRSLKLNTDGFQLLEKADICISNPHICHVDSIVYLLEQLHTVKSLKLNLEVIELLSSSVELILHQPSPFVNLKNVSIYPVKVEKHELPKKKVTISTEVKNYLLDGCTGANITMVSREVYMYIFVSAMDDT
ncbi:F-box/LRR-repeat protein At3g26922-like [Rutidosis leptorrhynchoides]|uniref:F-box/LRR-repeat protein At3g26922-like n=1 Tax=Rutidosis leptorrhynchoides TaxID=125765 RepID=UPI003A98D486